MANPTLVQVGNRPGAYFALALFCAVFAFLAIGVWREIRRSYPRQGRMALILGFLVFVSPTTFLYASSLSGFYEAGVRDGRLVLHYLHPLTAEVELAHIAGIRTAPAFKGQWVLYVTDRHGMEYVSASSRRDTLLAATEQLRLLLGRQE